MRAPTIVAFWLILFVTEAWSQAQGKVGSEPSSMETFASRPGAHVVWSSEVGRMEHDGTQAVLTALVIEDSEQPLRKVRGVRVDLSSGYEHDRIFLDEEAAARTRSALVEIAEAVARAGSVGRTDCIGAKEFWPLYDWQWNKYHELNVDSCGVGTALVLHGRGKAGAFRFPGENPTRLAGILAIATDQLKLH